jgi:ketosteroid isomerase-like protein
MNRMVRMVFRAVAALAGVAPAAVAAEKPLARPAVAQPACARRGAAGVGELHRAWILTGWEKRAGDPPWEFDAKLGRFYDGSSDAVHLYDDFDPAHRVARSAAEYAAIWTPPFTALRSAHHAVIDGPDVLLGTGDLATSTLEFAARLEAADRKIIGIRTRSTTVWRCRGGAWKIVREHNSSRTLPDGAIDELVPTPVARPARAASGASNERLVAAAFQRWAAGGTRFFDELLAPDVKWTIAGSGPPAGIYHGRDDFIERAVTPLSKRLAAPVRPAVRGLWSDGQHVIVHWDGATAARDGQDYRNSYVWIMRMRSGKAVEVTAFLDLAAYQEVLRRVPDRAAR